VQHAHRTKIDQFDDLLGKGPAQLVIAFAADAEELDFLAFGGERGGALAGEPHNGGVERAAQPALGGADEEQMLLIAASAAEKPGRVLGSGDRGRDIAEHGIHAAGIGARRLRRGLGAAQLRGRDHLHGLGDFLRRLGGGDPVAEVFERGHGW
jgi:hypothetical protein